MGKDLPEVGSRLNFFDIYKKKLKEVDVKDSSFNSSLEM